LAEPSVERGETSAETVIAVPVVFAVLMIAVHAAAFLHGAQVAAVAASRGAAAGAVRGGTSEEAVAVASATVVGLSSRTAREPVALVDGEWIEVSVWIDVPPIAPFLPRTAVRSVREPLERYRYEDER
jgi:hypothetical protein